MKVLRSLHGVTGRHARIVSWVALTAWCCLIFALSAQPHLAVTDDRLLDLLSRKIAHAVEFGVLVVLASMTLRQEGLAVGPAARLGAGISMAYAITDEVHQRFVPGRIADWRDVLVDWAGALAVMMYLMIRARRRGASR